MRRLVLAWIGAASVIGCAQPMHLRPLPLAHDAKPIAAKSPADPAKTTNRRRDDATPPARANVPSRSRAAQQSLARLDLPPVLEAAVRPARMQETIAPSVEALPVPPPVPPRPPASPAALPSGDAYATGNWSLDQVTRLALENSPVLRRAQARIEAARGVAWQAGRWANPRWDTNNPEVLGLGRQNLYNAGFQMEIPMAGKKRLDRGAAEQLIREAMFAAISDRYDVLQSVRQQFFAVVAQERRISTLEELVVIASSARDVAQRKFEGGVVPKTDVLLLSIELQQAQVELQQAQTLLIGKRRQLAAAIGVPDLPVGDLQAELTSPVPKFDDGLVRRFVGSQNADILNARAEATRQRILLQRAEVEPYPNVYTGPATQWGAVPGANQFWYNFQFNIPLWDRNQGNIRAAKANNRDAAANIDVVQNKLLFQAADALGRHRAAVEVAERIRTGVLPTVEAYQAQVRNGYEARVFAVVQLFQAQRSLFETNLRYIDALENVWSTAAELSNLLQLERFP